MRNRVIVPVLATAFALAMFANGATTAHATNWGYQGGWAGSHGGGSVHCVSHGETLYRIAAMYGTTVHALAAANGIWNPNYVRAGQCLTIPSGGYHGGYDGDYHGGYHGGYNKPMPQPKYDNYGGYGKPSYGGNVYCVKYGDTLWSIAWRYGVSAWSIANANGIKNLNYIRAGQCLTIPAW